MTTSEADTVTLRVVPRKGKRIFRLLSGSMRSETTNRLLKLAARYRILPDGGLADFYVGVERDGRVCHVYLGAYDRRDQVELRPFYPDTIRIGMREDLAKLTGLDERTFQELDTDVFADVPSMFQRTHDLHSIEAAHFCVGDTVTIQTVRLF